MKNKIGFVAVGQAGGNIGLLFEQRGYSVLYINTSEEDLGTLENAKYKYHIPEGEGCNKDRHKAKQFLIDDFDRIAAEIESKINKEIIFVIFASGGGTGSGAGPMLVDLLIDEGRVAGAVTIIPAQDESVKAHINCYECFAELTAIERMSACFALDNGRGDKFSLNATFADAFCAFLEIPEKHQSREGNIDRAEVAETLKAHGMALVLRQTPGKSSETIRAIKENAFAEAEADHAVKYITASLSGSVLMSDLVTAIGVPVDTFQTSNGEETVCCISGLTFPKARLDTVYGKVDENRETIKKNLAATKETGMKEGINFLDGLETPEGAGKQAKPQSKRDIMSKYLK